MTLLSKCSKWRLWKKRGLVADGWFASTVSVGGVACTLVLGYSFDAAVVSSGLLNSAVNGCGSVTVVGLDFGAGELTATSTLEALASRQSERRVACNDWHHRSGLKANGRYGSEKIKEYVNASS